MIGRTALLSSTAMPAPQSSYGIVANDTPHTITLKDLCEALKRADKQHAERRYLTPAEQQEIWENRFRPMPTEAETREAEQLETYRWKQIGLITDFMLGPAPPLTSRRK